MKKLFTLICAIVACAGVAKAATAADIKQCKHSYVLIMDDATNNGTAKPGKGNLFGDGFFLDVTGGSVSASKGKVNPCASTTAEDGTVTYTYGEAFATKYAEYAGDHLNSFRIKNGQDQFALNVTAGSKVIILGQTHASRYPSIASAQADNTGKNASIGKVITNTVSTNGYFEWQATDDGVIYVGSFGGDYYIGMVIVEAVEATGTPTVKVGAQTYENGLYYCEVTCKPVNATVEDESYPTICTYTTDGTEPNEKSDVYTSPIKCYKNQTVKFQAYLNLGDGKAVADNICEGASNDGIVSFSFNAPTIAADGATFTVTSEYEGAKNYISYGDVADKESNGETLTESATVTAYSKIVNGSYTTFTTKSTTKDVYALNPIKEDITLSATGEVNDSIVPATTTAPAYTSYYIVNGAVAHDKMQFFFKNPVYGCLANADADNAKYQVPAGQQAYIKFDSNSSIAFLVADGDSCDITVTCSKNSCKTLNATNDESVTADRKCYVNVDGKTYGSDDITNGDVANLDGYLNVIKFGLTGGTHTFQKFSGTGNILISSINIKPAAAATAIKNVAAAAKKTVKALRNGQLVIETANGTFNAVGARVE